MFHKRLLQTIRFLVQEAEILFQGLCFMAIIPPLVVLSSIPILIYRWLLSLFTKYFCSSSFGELVNSTTNVYTSEFLPWHTPKGARCTIVVTLKLDGILPFQRIYNLMKTKWFCKPSNYPEFQQYIEFFMGFFFWKWEKDFKLENHLKIYRLKATSEEGVDEELRNFAEHQLNKPFIPKLSPWEGFVIHEKSVDKTYLIFRYHHGLADGFSSMNAFIEGLGGTSFSSLALPSPKNTEYGLTKNRFFTFFSFPFRLWIEFSHVLALTRASETPWHVPDEKKAWKQLYERTKPMPIQHIKEIKNRLGVTFTGVILSCFSAAISKSVVAKKETGLWRKPAPDSIPILTILPLKHEPNKLGNNLTGAVLQLPIKIGMKPMERLENVEKLLENAKKSTLPAIYNFVMKIIGSHFAPVATYLTNNRYFPVGFTNFPGPAVKVELGGKTIVSADFTVGGQVGIAGLNFMVISFRGSIRIAVAAEKAAMSREELKELVKAITDELEEFNRISRKNIVSGGNNND
ncbi:unnamed protein product [Orchesella dallaii]|uniref:O-acyltransferase WSD1 C-terminal domain-containing protein n=1 Tax=Orchesella dallaii TaxID=48710 RepID=A0ABP1Q0Y7_9HEXA